MTLDGMAQRLATMHDSNVVIVLDRWTKKGQLYLCSNLREPLSRHDAGIETNNIHSCVFVVRKSNSAIVTCNVTSVAHLGSFLQRFHPETTVFTISRTGIYETKAQ